MAAFNNDDNELMKQMFHRAPTGQGEQPLSFYGCSICDFCSISVVIDLLEGIQAESNITATVHWMDAIMPLTGSKCALKEHPEPGEAGTWWSQTAAGMKLGLSR